MRRTLGAMMVVLMVAGAVAALAGEPAAPPAPPVPVLGEGRGQVTLTWDEFVKITGYDPAKKGGQMLTIPWSEVETLLGVKVEKVGAGSTVDLPWAEFKALLEWSIKKGEKGLTPPPTDFILASSKYTGKLTDETADFTLEAKIEILREKGWKRIPILPGEVALTKVTLPDGAFLNSTGQAYEVITEKTGPMDVSLQFSVSVQKSAGINQVTFQRVAVGSSLLDLAIARENVDVKVASAQSLVAKTDAGNTLVVAAIPSSVPMSISWERALPKVAAAPTKLYAETRTMVAVAEGMLLCQESVTFSILHTAVRELKLLVPANCSVLTVTGSNLQDWRVDEKGELQVVLKAEVIGSYVLSITYERASTDSVEVPVIRASGVERERGFIAVIAVANVEIAAGQVTGATSIDVRQLPSDTVAMTNQPILLAFRYVGEKFSIPLTIKKHGEIGVLITIVDSAMFTGMQLDDGRRMTKVVYSVRNNRNQFLRLKMPQGAEIWSVEVSGNTVSPAKDDKGSVLIPLVRSTSGARELASFPAEIVYVETPEKTAAGHGKIRVELPTCEVPAMHVMYSYYLPTEGTYKSVWGGSRFSGVLRLVPEFASMATGPGAEVVEEEATKQAQQMEQQVNVRVEAQAKAAGVTPIRVRLPLNGKLFKLEKILALPSDPLWFEVEYSGWKAAE